MGVFEAADRVDPAPRSLIVTSRMRDLLGRLGERAIVNEIHRFELFANGKVAAIPLQRPDLVIERATLIRGLAEQAASCGVEISVGQRFTHLEPHGKGITLSVEHTQRRGSEKVAARTVIGADGAFSKVARTAGWTPQPTVPLIQALVELPQDLAPDTTRVWFLPEDTPYFYWLIPESKKRGVLGLIGEDGGQTRRALERFLGRRGITPLEFQGARIPLYRGWTPTRRRLGGGEVYLVGDAAGHVKVTTVGGIVTGFQGALGVAEEIIKGGSSRALRTLQRELDLHLLIRKALHHFVQEDYVRLLDLLNPSAKRSLSAFSRDEVSQVLRRIILSQPRFLLLGLRSLLSGGSLSTNTFGLCLRALLKAHS